MPKTIFYLLKGDYIPKANPWVTQSAVLFLLRSDGWTVMSLLCTLNRYMQIGNSHLDPPKYAEQVFLIFFPVVCGPFFRDPGTGKADATPTGDIKKLGKGSIWPQFKFLFRNTLNTTAYSIWSFMVHVLQL